MTKLTLIKCIIIGTIILLQQHIIAQCTNTGNVWDKSWISCSKRINPNPARPNSHWLLFEFNQSESISTSKIWNANRTGESPWGMRNIIVDYSIDGNTWITLGNFVVPKANENTSYDGVTGPDFGGIFLKKILITIETTYGNGNCASVAEVQFNIDTDTCYGVEDVCGVCNGPGKTTWFLDADNDGLGDINNIKNTCSQPAGYVSNSDDVCDTGVYGWADIGLIFEDNGCTGCHGNSGGLDLTSYATILNGGNKCGPNLLTGNNLVGVITIEGYNGCASDINGPSMNDRVGGALDNAEIAIIQSWVDSGAPEFCKCPTNSPDTDNDGVCDAMDECPGFDNNLIGSNCDDGHPCTSNDRYDIDCNCKGTPAIDTDRDGVCDVMDLAPNDPCTADGILDGHEPAAWTGSINNDCDSDGIPLGQGDLDDFVACINQFGFLPSSSCICEGSTKTGGGRYLSNIGVSEPPENAGGLPDGLLSGVIGGSDKLNLIYPYLAKSTEICFQLGFTDIEGIASIELNDLGTYLFENTAGIIDYGLQEFCVHTIEAGPQVVEISKLGLGGLKVDGSSYEFCECGISDFEELSPDCQCPNNQFQSTGEFMNEIGGIGNAYNAEGIPDGIVTAHISFFDTLILSYPQLEPSSKICITAGFTNADGLIHLQQSGMTVPFTNSLNNGNLLLQEFCFVTPEVLTDNLLYISEHGAGSFKIDGSIVYACNACTPSDPDIDNDGICDANDPCPNSINNDSDNDGICDNLDICIGFDDAIDSDNDGIPNGCDQCAGGNDLLDSDGDGVPNGCDQCPGHDDYIDYDGDGIPNACDSTPCLNFVTDLSKPLIDVDLEANFQIMTNGFLKNNSDLQYTAGNTLFFEKGFKINYGTTFLASIEPCSN